MDSGLAWSVLLSKPIFVITVVTMLLNHDAQLSISLQQILTTVMTNIVVDMSTDHAKYNIDIK